VSRPDWVPVATWELTRTLKRKDFLFSVLIMPFISVAVIFTIGWFKKREADRVHRIAVVTVKPSGKWAETTLRPLEGFVWIAPVPSERSLEGLKRAVNERRYDGAVILSADYATRGGVELVVRRSAPGWKSRLEEHLREQARLDRARALGLTAEALERIDAGVTTTELVTSPEGKVSRGDRLAAAVLTILLLMVVYVTASYMAIGITGEKQSRVTEVVVSAIAPQSWIDGKIVGYTVLGLAHALLWSAAALFVMILFRIPLPVGFNPAMLSVSVLLFIFGLLLYISLYALIMATIKDLQSTSKFQAYLYFLPLIPVFFVESVIKSPDAPWVMVVSQFPFFSPLMMPARLTVGGVSWWEIALALVLLAVAAYFLRRAAGTAFRIGMLMYGKELTLPELVRWAKQV
jgi:ABC-2 type transport system permease protein